MLTSKALLWGKQNLREAGIESAELDCELILARALGTTRYRLISDAPQQLSALEQKRFTRAIESRTQRVPLPYLTREKEFFGRSFLIWPGVFVPRPESELIIEIALSLLDSQSSPLVADVCCGSGCLGVTFACEFPKSKVIANDLSTLALHTTHSNAYRNHVQQRHLTIKSDLLSAYQDSFDVILFNPPYGNSQGVAQDIDPEVTHEPGRAIWAGPDGLLYYREAITNLAQILKPGGIALMEFDPPQAESLVQLVKRSLPSSQIRVHNDLAHKPRILEVKI